MGKLGKGEEFYIPTERDSEATLGFTLSLALILLSSSIFFRLAQQLILIKEKPHMKLKLQDFC